MWLFLLGLALGAFVGGIFYLSTRREISRLDEQRQLLHQEQQIVLEFMHNMVEAIGEGVDRTELFKRVVHAAILSTGALSACVFEKNVDGRLRGVVVEGLFPPQKPLPMSTAMKITTRTKFIEQVLRSEVLEMGEGLVGEVAKTGQGMLIADAGKDPRIIRHDDPSLTVWSIVLVPIRFKEKNLGVLAVANPADGLSFNETDFSLVDSLAEQAGLAIHNADIMNLQIEKNKLDLDLALASNIQRMLLPKNFPQKPGLEVDARYLPAQKVGGDLYDVFSVGRDKIGVAIADVSGKGIPASLLMAICQSNLRHFAKNCSSPALVLSRLNAVLNEEMSKDMFVTLVYAIVDPKKDEIIIARGGHELPLLGHKDEKTNLFRTHTVGSEGMALGMVPAKLFEEVIEDKIITFQKGDIFVLYTDGVTEASNFDGTEFSAERLADRIKELRALTASDLNQGILDSVARFSGSNGQTDDITLVTVKHS